MNRKSDLRLFPPKPCALLAKWGLIDPLIDWLIAQNPSLLSQWLLVAATHVGGLWDLCQHGPGAISFIPSFCYSSAEREAWDWICSVMESSTLFLIGGGGGYRSDKAPDLLGQKKVDQKVHAEDGLCFSWALAAFTQEDEAQIGRLCVEEEWGRVEGSGTPGWWCIGSSCSLVSSMWIRCQEVTAPCWGKCSASTTVVAFQWTASLREGMHLFLF